MACAGEGRINLIIGRSLTKNNLTTCEGLGDMLRVNSTLRELYLTDNQIGDHVQEWCEALGSNLGLHGLYLEQNGISTCAALVAGLRNNTSLLFLDLSENSLVNVDCVADHLARPSCPLVQLSLDLNQIESCASIGKALRTNQKLEELRLKNNKLRHGLEELSEGIAASPHRRLESLHISSNDFSDSEKEAFKQKLLVLPRPKPKLWE